jgi:arginyl-tRNA synthetase
MGAIINARIQQCFGDPIHNDKLETLLKAYPNLIRNSDKYPEFARAFKQKFSDLLHTNLGNLENEYIKALELEKTDPKVAEENRKRTLDLHDGDPVATYFWEQAREITLKACFDVYKSLVAKGQQIFNEKDIRGESFYSDKLGDVVEDLKKRGLARKSDGAICVFPKGFKNKEGQELPLIIQKSDGAYLYATTDLAAIRYRVGQLKADRIIYVTDARQSLHFEMLFAVARMAGWAKTNVKLSELLDEAIGRAGKIVEEKNPELPAEKKAQIAKAVGIGAVKYADYSNNRTSDYIFSFDKILAMDGNTAPYMQYAYARIKSIERKAQSRDLEIETELAGIKALNLTESAELDLAKYLLRYGEVIESVAADYRPNYLTGYLYELAQKFSGFYTNCPVLKAGPDKRPTRLLLCNLTCKTIRHGLKELLGIEVVEQM